LLESDDDSGEIRDDDDDDEDEDSDPLPRKICNIGINQSNLIELKN
jgi:hypothetical protein